MQISHTEVRRHPIWQREVHSERQVAGPRHRLSLLARTTLATLAGVAAVASALIAII
ncbi:MAG: hypothetical protein ABIZ91_04010 [Gemmatimonadaceae bacterium]